MRYLFAFLAGLVAGAVMAATSKTMSAALDDQRARGLVAAADAATEAAAAEHLRAMGVKVGQG